MSDEMPPLPELDFTRIGPAVGGRFPDIVLPNQHGRLVDLHPARGNRRALVLFHRSALW
jgi:peroxiredoxin